MTRTWLLPVGLALCMNAAGCASTDGTFVSCDEPSGTAALELFPPDFPVFGPPGECLPPERLLLINRSDETVRVEALGTGDDGDVELLAPTDLPRDLDPSESLAIDLVVRSSGLATLSALTSSGCEQFTVPTIYSATGGRLAVPAAVDFGTFDPGEIGEPVEIEFTAYNLSEDSRIFSGGATLDVFEVLSPIEPWQGNRCETLTMTVRFVAPLGSGVYEADLFFETVIDGFAGISYFKLRAVVR